MTEGKMQGSGEKYSKCSKLKNCTRSTDLLLPVALRDQARN